MEMIVGVNDNGGDSGNEWNLALELMIVGMNYPRPPKWDPYKII